MTKKSFKKNQSVEKVFDIIEIMAKYGEPIRLNELSEKLGMSTPTVYRFLNTLLNKEYVRKDEESSKYYLTLKLKYLTDLMHEQFSISRIVYPYLKLLANKTGETASFVIMENNMAVYVDKCEGSDKMVKSFQRIGYRAPLYCTGVGKVFLSELSDEEKEKIFSDSGPLEKLTENTITDIQELNKELAIIKERGYSYDNEECEIGAKCIAAPLRNFSGKIIASISVSGPSSRMTEDTLENIKKELLKVSKEISKILGFVDKRQEP